MKAGNPSTNIVNLATALHREALAVQLHRAPGWISRSFDSKAPTTTLIASGRIDGAARFVTRLQLDFKS